MTRIRLGISTCPNDTFAFHGLLERAIDLPGLELDIELLDVQELNERLARGDFDVAKASFFAALALADEVGVLPAGSALGFGVGPVLLAARPGDVPSRIRADGRPARVLCPGERTTAHLLYRSFHSDEGSVEQTVFDRIMPALESGAADFGVCIHEGRFTYAARGLHLVEDLGETWERATGSPLPLGGILARHRLGADVHRRMTDAIRRSLDHARRHPHAALVTMRRHAQELDDRAILQHVELYVNEWTHDLGEVGRRALECLAERARATNLAPLSAPLRVLGR